MSYFQKKSQYFDYYFFQKKKETKLKSQEEKLTYISVGLIMM